MAQEFHLTMLYRKPDLFRLQASGGSDGKKHVYERLTFDEGIAQIKALRIAEQTAEMAAEPAAPVAAAPAPAEPVKAAPAPEPPADSAAEEAAPSV